MRFGFQLYSSRNFPPLAPLLARLAEMGYGAVEGYEAVLPDIAAAEALAAAMPAGLRMPTAQFGLAYLENRPADVLRIAEILEIERIYCPHIEAGERPVDAPGWRAFGARLEAAGAPLRAAGLGFGWHNHDFEFAPLPDGSLPMARLFEGGPLLEWEADLAWIVKGGADVQAWLEAEAGRLTAVHVKDIAPEGMAISEDGWADIGRGVLPWADWIPRLRAAGVQHFHAEHDNPSDDMRFARASLAALQGMA